MVGTAQSGAIATFVERKSGYLLAAVLSDKTAKSFEIAAKQCFAAIPTKYRKTLTLDNGVEMSSYEQMERTNGFRIYFAHLTQEVLDQAVEELNTRTRKRLGYKTPAQALNLLLGCHCKKHTILGRA